MEGNEKKYALGMNVIGVEIADVFFANEKYFQLRKKREHLFISSPENGDFSQKGLYSQGHTEFRNGAMRGKGALAQGFYTIAQNR